MENPTIYQVLFLGGLEYIDKISPIQINILEVCNFSKAREMVSRIVM